MNSTIESFSPEITINCSHCAQQTIVVITGLSHQELDEKTESDPSIVICWK